MEPLPHLIANFVNDPHSFVKTAEAMIYANRYLAGAAAIAVMAGFYAASSDFVKDLDLLGSNRRARRKSQKTERKLLVRSMGSYPEAKGAGLCRNTKLKFSGIVIGKIGRKILTFQGDEPTLITGGTRTGKGTGYNRATLLSYGGPVVAYDGGKGEAFRETSGWRSTFSHVLNFDLTDIRSVHWNPMDEIRMEYLVRDTDNLVESVQRPEKPDPHFEPAADSYMGAIIMHLKVVGPEEDMNMAGVLRFVSQGDQGARKIILAKSHPVAVARATTLFGSSEADVNSDEGLKYRQSVYNSARLRLKAFEEDTVAAVTSRSDFCLADLQTPSREGKPVTLYLSTPASEDARVRPIISLFFSMLMNSILFNPKKTSDDRDKGRMMLLQIDEFVSLRMKLLETAITKIVGFGATMQLSAQSLSALLAPPYGIYNQFRDNIKVHVAFASGDKVTQEAISEAIGNFYAPSTSTSNSFNLEKFSGNYSTSHSQSRRLIMDPGAVRALWDTDEVILIRGQPPILAQKLVDYKNRILKRRLNLTPAPMRSGRGVYPDLPHRATVNTEARKAA